MIRMFQSQTSGQAKSYFRDSLSKADYYIEDQELNGVFNGRIAARLGIENTMIDKAVFEKLCDNINPKTGTSLTPRTLKNRRVGYDISFHCPKSVSILHALSDDDTTLKAFQESVHETMLEMERDMQTRIRMQGQYDDRQTGELLWSDFVHQTARPVDGHAPDPHLHCHCFTFNVTYDEVEGRLKAGQFHNIKQDMPYYQSRFQKRLADKLSDIGWGIRKTNNGFEVAVIPEQAIDFFSKRTNLIGQVAKEKGITDARELDKLGAKTRAKKQKNRTMPELQDIWRGEMSKAGIDDKTPEETRTVDLSHTPEHAIDHAIDHSFTRKSVLRDRQILSQAYHYAIDNKSMTLEAIDRAFDKNEMIFKIDVGSQKLCTTQVVHDQERRMINLARSGIGQLRPLSSNFIPTISSRLNDEQQNAVRHVMTAQDLVTMISGGAGTGKTTLFKSLVKDIEKTGKQAYLFAPTAEAARDVLKKEGFEKADTVAKLFLDKKLQDNLQGHVMIVDEAGMLGTQDMVSLLEIADKQNARLVLCGDARQHTAVLRGDAMRLMRDVGKIPQVSLNTIYRQKNDTYKQAVKQISQGNIKTGFDILDGMGSIKNFDPSEISGALVQDYLKARNSKKSALVITPTRANMKAINLDIRKGLRESKHIGKREKNFTTYQNLHLTTPQKEDIRSYKKGQIIQTSQNITSNNGGIKKGSALEVFEIKNKQIMVKDKLGKHHILPTQKAKNYDVFIRQDIRLSKGDDIRIINKNGFDEQGKRLNNRTNLTVTGFTKEGHIKTVKKSATQETEFILNKDNGNFDYAYCLTSYSSQGKTVDKVFIAQPSVTFPASNQQQFYVSTSRAREEVTIYTDDKKELLKTIKQAGDRQGATEIIKSDHFKTPTINIDSFNDKPITKENTKTPDIDYEPEL